MQKRACFRIAHPGSRPVDRLTLPGVSRGGIGLKTNSDVTLIQRKITLVAGFSMPSTSENNLKCELFPG